MVDGLVVLIVVVVVANGSEFLVGFSWWLERDSVRENRGVRQATRGGQKREPAQQQKQEINHNRVISLQKAGDGVESRSPRK